MDYVNESTTQVRVIVRKHRFGDEPAHTFILLPGDRCNIPNGAYEAIDNGYRELTADEAQTLANQQGLPPAIAPTLSDEELAKIAAAGGGELQPIVPAQQQIGDGTGVVSAAEAALLSSVAGNPEVEAVEAPPPVDNDHIAEGSERFAEPVVDPAVNDVAPEPVAAAG